MNLHGVLLFPSGIFNNERGLFSALIGRSGVGEGQNSSLFCWVHLFFPFFSPAGSLCSPTTCDASGMSPRPVGECLNFDWDIIVDVKVLMNLSGLSPPG